MSTHENAPGGKPGAKVKPDADGLTTASITDRAPTSDAPELVVWDCACGRIHHTGALSALASACRPERVEVRR